MSRVLVSPKDLILVVMHVSTAVHCDGELQAIRRLAAKSSKSQALGSKRKVLVEVSDISTLLQCAWRIPTAPTSLNLIRALGRFEAQYQTKKAKFEAKRVQALTLTLEAETHPNKVELVKFLRPLLGRSLSECMDLANKLCNEGEPITVREGDLLSSPLFELSEKAESWGFSVQLS